jgi:hypothetical protein
MVSENCLLHTLMFTVVPHHYFKIILQKADYRTKPTQSKPGPGGPRTGSPRRGAIPGTVVVEENIAMQAFGRLIWEETTSGRDNRRCRSLKWKWRLILLSQSSLGVNS